MKLTRLILSLTTLSLALTAQTPAQVAPSPATAQPRLLSMFFDLNTMDAETLSRALENAAKFVQEQMTQADRVSVMTYGTKLSVLQDFTDNHDSLLQALRTIVPNNAPAEAPNPAAANQSPEYTIFVADRQLAAIQNAVELLAALPEKKAMIYFSSGIPKNGIDNQAQLRATTSAAIRANVSIYSVDSRGLVAAPK
jgi:VWFA-related protein